MLITRAIKERAEAFRLVRSIQYFAFETKDAESDWKQALAIPFAVHQELIGAFRHKANVDLLLRGAVLKGYSTFDYEGEQYGITLVFEPTDEGSETVTGHIRHVTNGY